MGLDQYAYAAAKARYRDDWYDGASYNKDLGDYVNTKMTRPIELAYWRKHPNLQGWMEQLWVTKGYPGMPHGQTAYSCSFNGIELELTWEDLDKLSQDIESGLVASLGTTGFFFGESKDYYYRDHDLEFVKKAKTELFCGLKVFYNSSW